MTVLLRVFPWIRGFQTNRVAIQPASPVFTMATVRPKTPGRVKAIDEKLQLGRPRSGTGTALWWAYAQANQPSVKKCDLTRNED